MVRPRSDSQRPPMDSAHSPAQRISPELSRVLEGVNSILEHYGEPPLTAYAPRPATQGAQPTAEQQHRLPPGADSPDGVRSVAYRDAAGQIMYVKVPGSSTAQYQPGTDLARPFPPIGSAAGQSMQAALYHPGPGMSLYPPAQYVDPRVGEAPLTDRQRWSLYQDNRMASRALQVPQTMQSGPAGPPSFSRPQVHAQRHVPLTSSPLRQAQTLTARPTTRSMTASSASPQTKPMSPTRGFGPFVQQPAPVDADLPVWQREWRRNKFHILYQPRSHTFSDLEEHDFQLMCAHYRVWRALVPGKSPTALVALSLPLPDSKIPEAQQGPKKKRSKEPRRDPNERVVGEINFWELGEDVGYARQAGWISEVYVLGAVLGRPIDRITGAATPYVPPEIGRTRNHAVGVGPVL